MDDHDDLSERDLSGIPDQDLSEEERAELKRRMGDFVERMQVRRLDKAGQAGTSAAAPETKPTSQTEAKRHTPWDPAAPARGH